VTASESIQARLARPFDPAELRRVKRLWVRHSIAEDRRDIDGLIATLSPDCVYEIAVTGQRWEGHAGARAFYTELFAAFPDNAFALSEIVVGPQGVFEVATHKVEYTHDMESVQQRHLDARNACVLDFEKAMLGAARRARLKMPIPAAVAAQGLHALISGLIQNWLLDPAAFDLVACGRRTFRVYLAGLGFARPLASAA